MPGPLRAQGDSRVASRIRTTLRTDRPSLLRAPPGQPLAARAGARRRLLRRRQLVRSGFQRPHNSDLAELCLRACDLLARQVAELSIFIGDAGVIGNKEAILDRFETPRPKRIAAR